MSSVIQKDLINLLIAPSDHYKGQNVCVTGEIKEYREKLEMIVKDPSSIEIHKM